MTPLEAAVGEAAAVLESLSIPYMLIGGLAVSLWGEPRATLDADLTVWVEPEDLASVVGVLSKRLTARVSDPEAFVRRTRVLPMTSAQGVRVDLIFATLPWEKQAIRRARIMEVSGTAVRVASVEDLILMKAVSDRQKDSDDVRALCRRHGRTLDRDYLEPRLRELAEALGRDDLRRLLPG